MPPSTELSPLMSQLRSYFPVSGFGIMGHDAWIISNSASADTKTFAQILSDAGYNVYICDGTDDDVQFQAAVDALSSGGNIYITPGAFSIGAKIDTKGYQLTIVGAGINATVLTLANGVDDDMFLIGAGGAADEPAVSISEMKLVGNSANNAAGSGVFLKSGLHSSLDRLYITDFPEDGVHLAGATASYRPDYATVNRCWIQSNIRHGIYAGTWVNALIIANNHISDNGNNTASEYAGVYLGGVFDCTLDNNMIWQNARANVIIDASAQVTVVGGTIGSAYYENIWLHGNGYCAVLNGVVLTDASLSGSGNAPSVLYGATGETFTELVIQGCTFIDNSGNHNYWIAGAGSGGTGVISNCTFRGTPATGLFAIDLTSFQIIGLRGVGTAFKTEFSDTATVANGSTSVVVTHNMGVVPSDVMVTPLEDPTNAVTFWWVDTITSTQCTIHVDADPGASNLDFRVRCTYGRGI